MSTETRPTRPAVLVEDFQRISAGHGYPGMPWPADCGATWDELCAAGGMVRARYWPREQPFEKHGVAFRPSPAGPVADLQPIADALGEIVHFTVMEAPSKEIWDAGQMDHSRSLASEERRQRAKWQHVRPTTATE